MNELIEEIMEEGATARCMGVPYLLNPHTYSEFKGAWAEGWTQEDNILRTGGEDQ